MVEIAHTEENFHGFSRAVWSPEVSRAVPVSAVHLPEIHKFPKEPS